MARTARLFYHIGTSGPDFTFDSLFGVTVKSQGAGLVTTFLRFIFNEKTHVDVPNCSWHVVAYSTHNHPPPGDLVTRSDLTDSKSLSLVTSGLLLWKMRTGHICVS